MIENGGCLPPLLSSMSLPAGEESNKEAFRFPIMETARRCFPAGCLPNIYALRIIPYSVFSACSSYRMNFTPSMHTVSSSSMSYSHVRLVTSISVS